MAAECFYIYEHTRNDSGSVFYVGKGKGQRCKSKQGRNKWWQAIVGKHGYSIRIRVKMQDEELAFLAEQEAIDQYRKLGVSLVNATDGGEGMTGHKMAPEVIERRAAKLRGRKRPDIAEMLRGIPKTAEHRAKLSASKTGKKASEETKRKMSETRKGRPSAMLGRKHSEESKRKTSEALKGEKNPFFGKKHPPEIMEKILLANIGRKDSEETRLKKSLARLGEKNPRFGVTISEDQKRRQIEALRSNPRVTCPHCNKTMDASNAKRWHFDNCKAKVE